MDKLIFKNPFIITAILICVDFLFELVGFVLWNFKIKVGAIVCFAFTGAVFVAIVVIALIGYVNAKKRGKNNG